MAPAAKASKKEILSRRRNVVIEGGDGFGAVGLGIGTFGVGSCTIIDRINAVAGASVQLSGTVTVPGTYCVEVFDLGNLVEPAAYTINVLHS